MVSRSGSDLQEQQMRKRPGSLSWFIQMYGDLQVHRWGGASYYVTFIDDATRKTWIYVLKHKSDVFSMFHKWKAMVENEAGAKVKC